MNRPIVSVILPVYNGSKYLRDSVLSILNQNISDIELIAINDASSDDSENILKEFTDRRIIHISNSTNIGLASTLNLGIEASKGLFIARMDQDDIAEPHRLGMQVQAFKKDNSLGVCGSNFQSFGAGGVNKSNYPSDHENIFTNLLFYNCIAHPTVMIRKAILTEYDLRYNKEFDWAEDFDLWTRARHLTKMLNLENSLLRYRINSSSMTSSGTNKVHVTVGKINKRSLLELGINPSEEDLNLHLNIGHHLVDPSNYHLIRKTNDYLSQIVLKNKEFKIYSEEILKGVIAKFWNPLLLKMSEENRFELLNQDLSKYLNSKEDIYWKLKNVQWKRKMKNFVGK